MDELFSRQMPHSLEAEQAVLGSILIDSRCTAQVIAALKPEDFYTELNRGIYEVVTSMFNFAKPIDAVTVLDEMKLQGTNAYSVMPDLLASRMEIGVLLFPKWNAITPTSLEIF